MHGMKLALAAAILITGWMRADALERIAKDDNDRMEAVKQSFDHHFAYDQWIVPSTGTRAVDCRATMPERKAQNREGTCDPDNQPVRARPFIWEHG